MAWTRNLAFVSVGDPVSEGYINQVIGNILEDDVAKVSQAGDLVIGSGNPTVERSVDGEIVREIDSPGVVLNIGAENNVLRSAPHPTLSNTFIPRWVSPASLSSDFVTWGKFVGPISEGGLGLR